MQQILSRVISGNTDQRAVLKNGQLTRNLAVLDNWSVLRIGIQFSFDGTATQAGNPMLAFGLCSGTSNGYADLTTTNFLGVRLAPAQTSITYNAGPPAYYSSVVSPVRTKRINTTITDGSGFGVAILMSSAPATARNALILQISKGSPNYGLDIAAPTAGANGAQSDCTDAQFLDMMEVGVMSGVSSIKAGYTGSTGGTMAFDQVAGLLDSVCIHWNKTATPLEISAIRVRKIS